MLSMNEKSMFEVVIGDEVAFLLGIKHQDSDFLEVIESSPDVFLSNLNDISPGDAYLDGRFFDTEGNERTLLIQDETFSTFVFVKDRHVIFIQDIPNTAEMIVAAYSSSPKFRKV